MSCTFLNTTRYGIGHGLNGGGVGVGSGNRSARAGAGVSTHASVSLPVPVTASGGAGASAADVVRDVEEALIDAAKEVSTPLVMYVCVCACRRSHCQTAGERF